MAAVFAYADAQKKALLPIGPRLSNLFLKPPSQWGAEGRADGGVGFGKGAGSHAPFQPRLILPDALPYPAPLRLPLK